jgi:dipeptidyl aminopeptidase/acylaminoacyl peptidase
MSYDIARYLSIDTVDSPAFTVDGDLLVRADTTGTPQIWRLRGPDRWPERLTPYDERVSTVDASPTRSEFVFGMDTGANERDQLYRYDLRTGDVARLTDDDDVIHSWGAWDPDGDRVAYAANRRERDTFDVYVQGRTKAYDDADRVFEGTGGWLSVATWGPDGRRLALLEPHGSRDLTVHLYDTETHELRTMGDDEDSFFADVTFGPEGERLYAVTDHGADTAYVGVVDPATGEIRAVAGDEPATGSDPDHRPEGGWGVDGLAMDRRTGRLVYTRNTDGYSTVHAGYVDREVVRESAAPAPGGVVPTVTFGPEGNRYAFVRSAPDDPYGVHVAEFGTDLVTEWTPVGTCGLPEETFRTPETVRYETFDGREIPAYFTLPPGVNDGGTVPVIVDIHGGPEHQRRPWFYPEKQFFTNRGYAVFEPNVRGSTGYGRTYAALDDVEKRMDSVRDVERAVAWLHDQRVVDSDRVVAYGRSYGGFMVLAAITQYPDLWAAAVEFVGIADFVTFLENTGEWRRSHREAEYGSLEDDRELLAEISPIHDVDRIRCPLFVQHGANDPRVPVGETEQIAAALKDRGVPVETLIFEDEGHHTTDRANLITEFERIAAFLDDHV